MPAETRLFLEGISLASVAIPAIACPLLLGGSAGRHFTAVQVVLRFIGGLVAGAAWFALAFGALAALGVVDTGASKCVPRSPAASRVHANSISAVSSPQPKEDASSFPSVFSGFKI